MVLLLQPLRPDARAPGRAGHVQHPDRSRWYRSTTLWAAVASGAVMLAVGSWGLNRGSMWQDEQVTVEVAHRHPGQIVALLGNVDAVHGLYYCFMHVWMLTGQGEVWARVPSVLAMAVSGGLVAFLGVRLANLRVGAVAGLLLAASPLASFYAQEARSYALVSAAVLLATCSLVSVLDGGARRWWVAYAAFMLLAVVLHELAILALLAHAATLVLTGARRPTWVRWLVVAVLCGAAVTPLAVLSNRQSGALDWMRPPTGATLLDLVHQLFGSTWWSLAPMVVLVGLGTASAYRRRPGRAAPDVPARRSLGLVAVALPLLVVPTTVLLVVSLAQPLFQLRYVAYGEAGVALLAALGLEVLMARVAQPPRRPVLGWAAAGAVVAALVVAQLPAQRFERTPDSRTDDLASAAAVVGQGAQPGDAVVFLPKRFRSTSLAYPDAFRGVDDIALAKTPARAHNIRGIDRGPRTVERAMLQRDRIWAVGQPGLRVGDDTPDALNELAVLRRDFVRERVVHVHGMDVALYVRRR